MRRQKKQFEDEKKNRKPASVVPVSMARLALGIMINRNLACICLVVFPVYLVQDMGMHCKTVSSRGLLHCLFPGALEATPRRIHHDDTLIHRSRLFAFLLGLKQL